MKKTMLHLMRVAGAFTPFRIANRDKALILTYHRFSRSGEGETTSARAFDEQLRYLTTRYRIVPLATVAEHLSRGQALPAGIAAIAIDDGYRDAYEIAFPILRKFNAPATLFVVTDFVDRKVWLWTDKVRFLVTHSKTENLDITINNRVLSLKLDGPALRLEAAARINSALKLAPDDLKDHVIFEIATLLGVRLPGTPPAEFGPISWAQAREMDAAGVQIGSHTATHPILTRVSDGRLRMEVCDSRSRLEAMLNREVDLFCYPNGDYDERVARAVRAAGYRCAVTVEAGLNGIDSDLLRLRRVHTDNNFARFLQSTSGFEQVKNRLVIAGRRVAAGASN
ncbi:MAG TPA: polysaccharide deacetylase family protein [Blastocatellia bacterium]|nr:polysaccharide deacetylase family protein [Blastocatellia bacterium]